jgi:hypothetical protein
MTKIHRLMQSQLAASPIRPLRGATTPARSSLEPTDPGTPAPRCVLTQAQRRFPTYSAADLDLPPRLRAQLASTCVLAEWLMTGHRLTVTDMTRRPNTSASGDGDHPSAHGTRAGGTSARHLSARDVATQASQERRGAGHEREEKEQTPAGEVGRRAARGREQQPSESGSPHAAPADQPAVSSQSEA